MFFTLPRWKKVNQSLSLTAFFLLLLAFSSASTQAQSVSSIESWELNTVLSADLQVYLNNGRTFSSNGQPGS